MPCPDICQNRLIETRSVFSDGQYFTQNLNFDFYILDTIASKTKFIVIHEQLHMCCVVCY